MSTSTLTETGNPSEIGGYKSYKEIPFAAAVMENKAHEFNSE